MKVHSQPLGPTVLIGTLSMIDILAFLRTLLSY